MFYDFYFILKKNMISPQSPMVLPTYVESIAQMMAK